MENYSIMQSNSQKSEFEPTKIDYYQVLIDLSFSLDRKIYDIGYENFTDYEKKTYLSFKETFQSDIELLGHLKKKHYENFIIDKFFNKQEDCLRFLNMFSYDIPTTLQNIKSMTDLMSKHDLLNFRLSCNNFLFSEVRTKQLKESINIFQLIRERDKSFRPNIKLVKDLHSISIHYDKSYVLKNILIFFNWVIEFKLLPGKVEQFNLFFKIDELIEFDNFLDDDLFDILKICQYAYASRLNKVYIFNVSYDTEKILAKFLPHLFLHSVCRIVLVNPGDLISDQDIDEDVSNKLFEKIFDPQYLIRSSIFQAKREKIKKNAEKNFFLINELYKSRSIKKINLNRDSKTNSTSISNNSSSVSPIISDMIKSKKKKESPKSICIVNAARKNFVSNKEIKSHTNFVKKEEIKSQNIWECNCPIF